MGTSPHLVVPGLRASTNCWPGERGRSQGGCCLCVAPGGEGEEIDASQGLQRRILDSTPPLSLEPSAFMPPGLGNPGKSRYEEFYKSPGEAIDVDSEQAENNEEDSITNPFFVGYEMEELGFIWDVHKTTVGERNPQEEEQEASLPGSAGGGLHDLILGICKEADKDKEREDQQS